LRIVSRGRIAMTLWTLTQSALLAANGVAVLNEARFLHPRGLSVYAIREGAVSASSLRGQVIGVINAVSYLRMPLVVLNSIVIFVKLVFG
jgi:immediate early response 3-interacting protein 1